MKRRAGMLLGVLLVTGVAMRNWQYWFTPEGAARMTHGVRGAVVASTRSADLAAFLFQEGEQYRAVAACRQALVLWTPCAHGGFWLDEHDPIPVTASSYAASDSQEVLLFGGRALDERVARITWGGEERDVTQPEPFVFVKQQPIHDPIPEAVAFTRDGEVLYRWSEETLYRWRQASEPVPVSVTAETSSPPGGCPALPAGWLPIESPDGKFTGAVFGPAHDAIFLGLKDGGVQILDPGHDQPSPPIGTHRYDGFRVSPDGSLLAGGVQGELWLLDLATRTEKPLGLKSHGVLGWTSPTTFVFVDYDALVVASYDLAEGSVTALTSTEGSAGYDYVTAVAELERLGGMVHADGSLSPDGTQVVLWQGHSGNAVVIRLDLNSGRMYAYPGTEGDGMSPRWEPDGRHVVHGWGPLKRLDTVTGEVEYLELGLSAMWIEDVSPSGRALVTVSAQCRAHGGLESVKGN